MSGTISGYVGMNCIRKVAEHSPVSKPVSGIPPWFPLQVIASSSCLGVLQWWTTTYNLQQTLSSTSQPHPEGMDSFPKSKGPSKNQDGRSYRFLSAPFVASTGLGVGFSESHRDCGVDHSNREHTRIYFGIRNVGHCTEGPNKVGGEDCGNI